MSLFANVTAGGTNRRPGPMVLGRDAAATENVMSGVVLVTGGAGHIGSHVSKPLPESGFTPVCYDTFEKGLQWAVGGGPL